MGILNRSLGKKVYIVIQDSFEDPSATVEVARDTSDIIMLTATESFSKTESAVVTNYPVANGTSRGDHYRKKGPVINFSGVISGSSLFGIESVVESLIGVAGNLTPELYVKAVKEILTNEESSLVTVYLPDGNAENNCVITDFVISRDNKLGNAYKVDVTAQKLLLADEEFVVIAGTETVESTINNAVEAGTNEAVEDVILSAEDLTPEAADAIQAAAPNATVTLSTPVDTLNGVNVGNMVIRNVLFPQGVF